jgi:hypothetical protein
MSLKITIRIEALVAVLLACAPAFAQTSPNDTIRVMLAKGAVFSADGQTYEFVAQPDGAYVDIAGAPKGTYRVDGAALCITPSVYGREVCFPVPEGRKSGETFEAVNQHGFSASIAIR